MQSAVYAFRSALKVPLWRLDCETTDTRRRTQTNSSAELLDVNGLWAYAEWCSLFHGVGGKKCLLR